MVGFLGLLETGQFDNDSTGVRFAQFMLSAVKVDGRFQCRSSAIAKSAVINCKAAFFVPNAIMHCVAPAAVWKNTENCTNTVIQLELRQYNIRISLD